MKKFLLSLGAFLTLPMVAQTTFEYNGVSYTVIDEGAKTCMTTPGTYDDENDYGYPQCYPTGDLVIPSKAYNEDIEYKVTKIGEYSFVVTDITGLYISEGIEEIDDWAFMGCYELQTVDLPSTLTSIGMEAFCWDGEVSTLVCRADMPPTCGEYALYICDWDTYNYNENLKVYVPDDYMAYYQNSSDFEWWYLYNYYLPLSDYKGTTPDAGVQTVIDPNLPVTVYDIHGRKVAEGNNALTLRNFNKGLYIIRQGKTTSKVIIQ